MTRTEAVDTAIERAARDENPFGGASDVEHAQDDRRLLAEEVLRLQAEVAELRENERVRQRDDCRLLAEEVTELRAILHDAPDGGNKAAKYWRQLQESRRENADLRAKGSNLAAENETLRADMVQATASGLAIRAERDAMLDKIRRVETALRDQP